MTPLLALRFADSAFPSGGFAFSWGLETAIRDGLVDRASLTHWIEADLRGRWYGFDRVALTGAFRGDAGEWDGIADAAIWSESLRRHSRAAGAAFLTAARRLGLPGVDALGDEAHLPVAQGTVFRGAGLTVHDALSVSLHAALQGHVSAAVRLNLLGALSAQRLALDLLPALSSLAAPPPEGELPGSFAPLSDLALLAPRPDRLFLN